MPIERDNETGEVLREWELTNEEVEAYLAEFEELYPGLLKRLGEMDD